MHLLVLSRRDVLDLLTFPDCIGAVERAFRLHAEGRTLGPGVLGVPAVDGGFHIKAAGLIGDRGYFAAKTNANFPQNPRRFGLPTIQGTIVLADASTGAPLAIIESGSVTALRTAAATAVAARFLARRAARTATIVGCGVQGELQLAAIASVLPLQRAWVLDADHEPAESMAVRAAGARGRRRGDRGLRDSSRHWARHGGEARWLTRPTIAARLTRPPEKGHSPCTKRSTQFRSGRGRPGGG